MFTRVQSFAQPARADRRQVARDPWRDETSRREEQASLGFICQEIHRATAASMP